MPQPTSLYNSLTPHITTNLSLLHSARASYTALHAEYTALLSLAPRRTARLNALARRAASLSTEKEECRARIKVEQERLRGLEEEGRGVREEWVRVEAEREDEERRRRGVRVRLGRLEGVIVGIDGDLEGLKGLVRRIERRARCGDVGVAALDGGHSGEADWCGVGEEAGLGVDGEVADCGDSAGHGAGGSRCGESVCGLVEGHVVPEGQGRGSAR